MGNNSKPGTFHLGITMAGAVSAGAYTAGFMDYILEALSAWEAAKKENENNPNSRLFVSAHDVSKSLCRSNTFQGSSSTC